ncbi:hypothetical protein HMPREF3198_02276 [Winkia neuii]|nr:hypothetical protein HMPREF3198_02276 [Winkia neuii]
MNILAYIPELVSLFAPAAFRKIKPAFSYAPTRPLAFQSPRSKSFIYFKKLPANRYNCVYYHIYAVINISY